MQMTSVIGRKKRRIVEPIRDKRIFQALRKRLEDRPRDLFFFDLATQTGIEMKHLIGFKVSDFSTLKIGDKIPFSGNNTDSRHCRIMTETLYRTFHRYVESEGLKEDDYLFKSRKGSNPLTPTSVSHLVRKWFTDADLTGLSGFSSLRKTWEFHGQKGLPAHRDIRAMPKALRPVDAATLQEAVYRELKQAILSGRILPGERLFAEKVAKQTNVSETPAREALTRLEAKGFLLRMRRKGFVVNELSTRDLREVLKIRLLVETMAVRNAFHHISEKTLGQLEDIFRRYKEARKNNDIERYFLLNKEFHHTIYTAADMPTLKTIIDLLWDRMSPYLQILIRDCDDYDPQTAWQCHRGILDGIKIRNPEEACRWLEVDLTRAAETLTRWFDHQRK